jgi:hypothetical protein
LAEYDDFQPGEVVILAYDKDVTLDEFLDSTPVYNTSDPPTPFKDIPVVEAYTSYTKPNYWIYVLLFVVVVVLVMVLVVKYKQSKK